MPSSLSYTDPHTSLSGLLNHFSSSVNDHSDSWITVEKSKVWPRELQFYKSAKVKDKQLRRQLCVEYVHEDGVHAGVLRGDFFEKVLTEVDHKLLEGNEVSRLPKTGLEPLPNPSYMLLKTAHQ